MSHPSAYQPETHRENIRHTLGMLGLVAIVFPVSLAHHAIQRASARIRGGFNR